jgi:hypothetical protein
MTSVIPVMGDVMGVVMAGPFDARGIDPDVLLWRDAVVTNGGTVSAVRLSVVDTFIRAEKASGTWTLTDDYWGFWAENAVQALTSLKQRRLATAVNSPTFTANAGYAFDGTTNYLNTGFIPSSHAVAMTATNARSAVYERTNVATSRYSLGVVVAGNRSLTVAPRVSGVVANGNAMSSNIAYDLPSADSRGLLSVGRDGSATPGHKNGVVLVGTNTPTLSALGLPDLAIFVGGYNAAGVVTTPRACSVGFVCWGAAMSDAQNLAQYNAVQAFATAVGAQV